MTNTARKTGLSDAVQIQDSSGTDLFSSVDVNISGATHDVTIPSDRLASIGSGASYVSRADQPVEVTGDISLRAISLKPFELIGNRTDNADVYTIEPTTDDILPEWDFVQQITDTETIHLSGYDDSGAEPSPAEGFKFDEATLSIEKDSPVSMSFSGLGLYAEVQSETITTNNSELDPENWLDAHVEIDGTEVGSVDSAEVTIARDGEAVRGIENQKENFKLLPTQVVERMRDVSFNMTIEITDSQAWQEVFDDDSTPLYASDDRSEVQINVVLGDRDDGDETNFSQGGEIQVKDALVTNASADLSDDAEVRTVDIEGNARSWTVKGEVS